YFKGVYRYQPKPGYQSCSDGLHGAIMDKADSIPWLRPLKALCGGAHKAADQGLVIFFSDNPHGGSVHVDGIVHQPLEGTTIDHGLPLAVGDMKTIGMTAKIAAL